MSNRTDNFNRANDATTLNTPSGGGGAWNAITGTWGVDTNRAYCVSGGDGACAALDSTTSDVDVQATFAVNQSTTGLMARAADTDNYILAQSNAGAYDLYKKVASIFTALFTGQGTAADGDVVKLRCSGTSVSLFVNGAQVGTTQTVTQLATNTLHGLRNGSSAGSLARWDDFSVTDLGGASATPAPPPAVVAAETHAAEWQE